MACPYSGSLGRLPGREYDKTPRRLRESFLAKEVDHGVFVEKNFWGLPRTREERFENKIKSYATASLVIDRYWKYVQGGHFERALAKLKEQHGSGPHQERVVNFMAVLLILLNKTRDRFIEESRAKRVPFKDMSEEDQILLCFFAVARKRHRHLGGLPFPSMNDLVVFFGRLAGVAPEVFRRDIGREPTEQEYFQLLRHPYMLRLCTDIMANDRKATHPLFALLEGKKKGNLNDINRTYLPELFEIHEEDGVYSMRIKSAVMAEYYSHYEKSARRRHKRKQPPRKVLGCPALYTGKFREMYEWNIRLFESWYSMQQQRTAA